MRSMMILASLLAASCSCSEVALSPIENKPPRAEIVSHEDGESALEGYTVTFRGTVDDDKEVTDLVVVWRANEDVVCDAPAEEDGSTSCDIEVPVAAELAVTLEARDVEGEFATARVVLPIAPTEAPVVVLTSPVPDRVFYADLPVLLEGTVSDAEDPPSALFALWESDRDGELASLGNGVDPLGETGGEVLLSEGEHVITLSGADSSGKSATDSVRITVAAPNQAPDCAIVGPDTGSRFQLGDPVALEGTVDDAHDAPETLAIAWTSDRDGLLGTDPADASGAVSLTTTTLSRGRHEVTLTATDELATVCTATLSLDVVGPPSALIVEPLPDSFAPTGEPITFRAQVADGEDPADQLALSWVSDRLGEFDTRPADPGGEVEFTAVFVDPGLHRITFSATDRDGQTATDQVDITLDGRPSAPVVDVVPDPARSDEDLVAVILTEGVDPEGAEVEYRYAWFVDSVLEPNLLTETVPASYTTKGDTWEVVVTPSDGNLDGPSGRADATVVNTPPELAGIAIQPSPAYTEHDLYVRLDGWSDADGDPEDVTYVWKVNNVYAGDEAILSRTLTDRGNTVSVTVTPKDDADQGPPVTDSIVIQNSPPRADSAVIGPDPAYSDTTLYVTVNGWYDSDNDPEGYGYTWYVDGFAVPGENGPTLSGVYFARGDDVWVEVTPFDGADAGPMITAPFVTIRNGPPELVEVDLSPARPRDDDVITAIPIGWSDPDADPPVYRYQWYIDGFPVQAGGTGPSLSADLTEPTDVVYVEVTPWDGTDLGPMVASEEVVVANDSPTAPVVHIEPAAPESSDDLICVIDDLATDPEGDPITYHFTWLRDGVPFDNGADGDYPNDTVLDPFTNPGQLWECQVRAFDGFSEGPPGVDSVVIRDPRVSVLSLGDYHACLVDTAEQSACWGWSNQGRLGLSGGTYVDIAAGGSHTCALTPTGSVVCDGINTNGQAPPNVPGTFTAIAAGWNHSCAIVASDGSVQCWGNPQDGGTDTSGLTSVYVKLTLGHRFGCAIDVNFDVDCWGDSAFGKTTPPPGVDFTQIDSGYNHTCGVSPAGTGYCWGNNDYGKTTVPGGTWRWITAGRNHSCGLRPDQTIVCWGQGTSGGVNTPVQAQYTRIDAGFDFTCGARAADGEVACWGLDDYGQASPPNPWW